jgi:Carbohydrate esterase, sialic acid-specific acetylesterase
MNRKIFAINIFLKICLLIFITIIFTNTTLFGQITLNMPANRSVFQRVNNLASIQIGGNLDANYSELQVKLEVLNGGIAVNWKTLKTNPTAGPFRVTLPNVTAGWYELEVRVLQNGIPVGTIAEVPRVGVGEVFIVAGQSNAQGGRNNADFATQIYYGAQDDRVNCIDYFENSPTSNFPYPIISKIAPETNIAPRGLASWCWALLGDRIAQNWNVPVLFFNAAAGATVAQNWSDSANEIPYYNYYGNYITDNSPYLYLKKSLEYYGKIYGVRSVLWHQGETDIFQFDELPEKKTNYKNNVLNIIDKSRTQIGGNLSWMIARVSRFSDWTSTGLIQCQTEIGSIPNLNTFIGPATDDIQPGSIYRDGGVHFKGTGFIELADAWYNAFMSNNFINGSNPLSGSNNLEVINGQFVIGQNLPTCVGAIESISSGNWYDPAVWSCGIVPDITKDVIINSGHTVEIGNYTAYAKSITNNGTMIFSDQGLLILGQ